MNKDRHNHLGKQLVKQDLNETRKCPHCKTEVAIKYGKCPTCGHYLRWAKSGANLYADFVQSPLPNIITWCACILAVVGQICIYLLDNSVNEYFHNRLSLPPISTLHITGHLLKTIGETTLLFCLMQGLRYEYRRFGILIKVTMVLLLLYHLLAAYLPVVTATAPSVAYFKGFYNACLALLVVAEVSYFYLGCRLNSAFIGQISYLGFFMIICSGLHVALSAVLNLASKEFYSDTAIMVLTIVYLFHLRGRLLDFSSYNNMVERMKDDSNPI